LGQVLHGSATTTEAIRRWIQNCQESLRVLTKRNGINQKTVAKWRKRTSAADLPTGPKETHSTVLSLEDEAIIVEFGTSFGISTLCLASTAVDTGGHVTGSEFHPRKAGKAVPNLSDAGLSEFATVHVGDARNTFAGLQGPIDLLFLDGAKDLYFDILLMLEDRLRPGSIVIADNADTLPENEDFLVHVANPEGRYVSTLLTIRGGLVGHAIVSS